MRSATFVLLPNPILYNVLMYPKLGAQYVAAMMAERGVKINWSDGRLAQGILDCSWIPDADYICISSTSGEIDYARRVSWLCKGRNPRTTTVIGGCHASFLPEECTEDFDVVVVGEGEYAVDAILQGARGIIRMPRIKDLDSLPFPLRPEWVFSEELMPGERCGKGDRATTLMSARGCPYKCSFCANLHKAPVVFRSPENVAEEVKALKEIYHCSAFRDSNDDLGLNKKWIFKLCEFLAPLEVLWKGHTRSDLIDDERCEALKMAGFTEMGVGVESADQRVLDLNNKEESVEEHKRAISILKRHGILAKAYFIVGLPGETEETLRLNREFVRETQPDKYTACIFCPHPGSDIWRDPKKYGITIRHSEYHKYWNWPDMPIHEMDGASAGEIIERYVKFQEFLDRGEWRWR